MSLDLSGLSYTLQSHGERRSVVLHIIFTQIYLTDLEDITIIPGITAMKMKGNLKTNVPLLPMKT